MEENKKSASPKINFGYSKKWRIVCIKGGMSLPVVACHDRPSEALHSGYAISKLRSASPSLAWSCPRYAISDGRLVPRGDSMHSWLGWDGGVLMDEVEQKVVGRGCGMRDLSLSHLRLTIFSLSRHKVTFGACAPNRC